MNRYLWPVALLVAGSLGFGVSAVAAANLVANPSSLAWAAHNHKSRISQRPNRITHVRVCGHDTVKRPTSRCAIDERATPVTARQFECSAFVFVGARHAVVYASFTYEGQLVVRRHWRLRHGWRPIWVYMFSDVPTPQPGGHYACQISLGNQRAVVTFQSAGLTGPIVAPAVCETLDTERGFCLSDESGTPFAESTQSVTCTGLFPNLKGHPVEIDFLRLNPDGTTTTMLAWRHTLLHPISSVSVSLNNVLLDISWTPGGQYSCRYLLDGAVVADKHFTVSGSSASPSRPSSCYSLLADRGPGAALWLSVGRRVDEARGDRRTN